MYILILVLFTFLVINKHINQKNSEKFIYLIHINGIRGKTQVCRLLDAALRQEGFAVFTKTTGTHATTIGVDGKEKPIPRRFAPNILEQQKIMAQAAKEGAQILIIECMAIHPLLQIAAQDKILRGNIGVVTNVRLDHIWDMGEKPEEIAKSLAAVFPKNGMAFTAEKGETLPLLQKLAAKRNCKLYAVDDSADAQDSSLEINQGDGLDPLHESATIVDNLQDTQNNLHNKKVAWTSDSNLQNEAEIVSADNIIKEVDSVFESIFSQNLALTKAICHYIKPNANFKIDYSLFQQDFGALQLYKTSYGTDFLNLFSVNDPQSTFYLLQQLAQNYTNILFLYNNRRDRGDRLYLFNRYFYTKNSPLFPFKLHVLGENSNLAKRVFSKNPSIHLLDQNPLLHPQDPGTLIVGIGNIKGAGEQIINELEGLWTN